MRVYSDLATSRMANNQTLAGFFKLVLLTRSPATPLTDAAPSIDALLDDIGYQELVDSHYTVPGERPTVQTSQATASGTTDVLIGSDIALPADVAPVYIAAVAFYFDGTLNGVVNPWIMITDESFGQTVYPGSTLTTVAQSPRKLWSFSLRGTSAPYIVDTFASGLIRSPGNRAWEPPRTQHIYLYPQKVNYVPNPSFEDVGNFGWRANGPITRVVGGVDGALKYHGRVVGTRLEGVPSLLSSKFACISAYVRASAAGSSVRLNGTAGTYITGPDIAAIGGATTLKVEVDCSLVDWTPAAETPLASQLPPSAPNLGWAHRITTGGAQRFVASETGSVANSYNGPATGFVDGSRHKVGGTWTAVSGISSTVQFTVDGANVGAPATTSTMPGGLFNSTVPVRIGANSDGSVRMNGNIYGLKLWANGVLVASPDFTRMAAGQTSVTDAQGNVWAVNGAASVSSPVASWVQMGLCNWNGSWTQVEDTLSEQKPLVNTWTRHNFVTLVPDNLAGSGVLFVSDGAFDVDLVMLEQGADLNDYFDGDAATGILGDFSWQGITHQSLSFWYNNRYLVGARLFGTYVTGGIEQNGLVYDWVPAGTSIATHWDVLSMTDTRQPMVDFASRSI